jgi:transposase InsO family protein
LDKEARFEIIFEMKKKYTITVLFRIAEVSRAGYYKWRATFEKRLEREALDLDMKEHILAIHHLRPHYGYYRMRTTLRKEGIGINHKKVRRLMRELGIRSVIRKKRPFAGRKPSVIFPNVLNREFTAEVAMKKLVTDITYVRIGTSLCTYPLY